MDRKRFKETGIGTIPFDWDVSTIQDHCEKPQYGFTDSASDIPVGPRFLRITDITETGVLWDSVPFCQCSTDDLPKYRLRHNDIVFARIGGTTGKSFLIKKPPKAVFASYLIRLRTLPTVFPDFLYYFFQGKEYWKQIDANKGSNLKGGVNGSILSKVSFPRPTPLEQKKIACVLSKLQKAIDVQDQLIQSLRDLKKSTMSHLFTHGLKGEKLKKTEIGMMPQSWDVKCIGDIAKVNAGGTPDRSVENYWEGGTIPWIKTGEINYSTITRAEECITEDGLKNSAAKVFPKGTLLIAMYGQGITRGRVAILGIDAATNQACAGVFLFADASVDFLFQNLAWSYDRLRSMAHGAQQKNLSGQLIKAFQIGIPSDIEEQIEIAHILQTIDKKLENHELQKASYQALFKTMLNKLMTGQIRVRDSDIDTTEVDAA